MEKKSPITHEDMLELGWIEKSHRNLDLAKSTMSYEKGNYWVNFQKQEDYEIMIVLARDPVAIDWMPLSPEQFRIITRRPTLEAFKTIMAFI